MNFCLGLNNENILSIKRSKPLVIFFPLRNCEIYKYPKRKLEVVVIDDASSDNTSEVVRKLQKKAGVALIYHRNDENLGIDKNFLKVVGLARGEYCWLLGDDDHIVPGAIDKVLGIGVADKVRTLMFLESALNLSL